MFNLTFDKAAYAANDQYAKELVSGVLVQRWGYEVRENPDPMGIDLLLSISGQYRASVEVECRNSAGWGSGQDFPYPSHQTSIRKHRFINEPNHWLVTINSHGTNAICSPLWDNEPEISRKNVGPRGEESFYNFNTGKALFLSLN